MGLSGQDRAEQGVIEPQFAGTGNFCRAMAGGTNPGEVRACGACCEARSREVDAVSTNAVRDFLTVVDDDQRPMIVRQSANSLGKPQTLGCWPALVAYLYQPQPVVQGFVQPFQLALDAFALAHADRHGGRQSQCFQDGIIGRQNR